MVSTLKWASAEAIASALTTELNSLASGSYTAASSAIANQTDLYEFISLELVLASLTPTGSPYVNVYLLASVDGTNYEDGGGSTVPAAGTLLCTFDLSTSASAKRRTKSNLQIPPFSFKLVALNASGVSLAASGNTLKYRRHNEQAV